MSKVRKKTQLISKRLSSTKLTRIDESEINLNCDNLIDRKPEQRGTPFFLGYYSKSGIKLALEKYGVFEEFKKRGFIDPHLKIDTGDPFHQRLSFYFKDNNKEHLLVEAVLKRKYFATYSSFPSKINGRSFEFLFVEWLTMQDPQAKFSADRPKLPGQEYPGLGMGKLASELLFISCKRLRLAGVLTVPEYFHNAQMYSKIFHFLNPDSEGKRLAIERDLLKKYRLADVTWAIDLHCVKENNKPFSWFVSELIMPLERDIEDYFSSSEYKRRVKEASKKYNYTVDKERWEKKKINTKKFQS